MINPATGWFEIVEVPKFGLDKVTGGNDEYIDYSYSRVSQLFNTTQLSRYLSPWKFVFYNGSEFKFDLTPLLNYFYIEPVCMTLNKPQSNALVERVHQVIYNMIVAKDIDDRVFEYIYPWCETLHFVILANFYFWSYYVPSWAYVSKLSFSPFNLSFHCIPAQSSKLPISFIGQYNKGKSNQIVKIASVRTNWDRPFVSYLILFGPRW